MEAEYIIIGAGPTGMSLAYNLAKNDISVIVLEKSESVGGSWNSEFIDRKYFAENSPRVLFNTGPHMDFLYEIGMRDEDFANIYGNIAVTYFQMLSFLLSNIEFQDYSIIIKAVVRYSFTNVNTNTSLAEWLSESSMSEKGKNMIRKISILISDIPEKTNVVDFFNTITPKGMNFIQMRDPNKWHNLLKERFKKMKNIRILTNCEVRSLSGFSKSSLNFKIQQAEYFDHKSKKKMIINAKRFVLCCQSDAICRILQQSDDIIHNNWNSIEWMSDWCEKTQYNSIGFQFHFKKDVVFPSKWNWSVDTDWSLIIQPVSNWLTNISRDDNIKTVWSCCIIDFYTKSERIKKSPNECTIEEIISESIRQLREIYETLPDPDVVTVSSGLHFKNDKWISKNSGFTRGVHDYLPIHGKSCSNLFALGCFTKTTPSISHMGKAVEATEKFLDEFEKRVIERIFSRTWMDRNINILLLLLVLLLIKKTAKF